MKTSGNGTSAIQVLYLLWNIPQIHRVKCGITGNLKNRRKNISESTFWIVFPVFFVIIQFAWQVEQSIHNVFRRWNRPLKGSGGPEWFSVVVAPFILLAMIGYQILFAAMFFLIGLSIYWVASDCPKEPIESISRIIF